MQKYILKDYIQIRHSPHIPVTENLRNKIVCFS